MKEDWKYPIFIRELKLIPKKCVAKCQICGKYFVGITRSVKFRKYKSCGCHYKNKSLGHHIVDKLLVLREYAKFHRESSGKWHKTWWCFCRCFCGTYKEMRKHSITKPTKHHSCGCDIRRINAQVQFKHGWAGTRFYDVYKMLQNT